LLQLSSDPLLQASTCGPHAAGDGGEGGGWRDNVPLDPEGGSENDMVKTLVGVEMEELVDSFCCLNTREALSDGGAGKNNDVFAEMWRGDRLKILYGFGVVYASGQIILLRPWQGHGNLGRPGGS
jgi:hypothetical protein